MATTRSIMKSLSNRGAASRKNFRQNRAASQKKVKYEEINVTYDMVEINDLSDKFLSEEHERIPKKLFVAKERLDRLKNIYHKQRELEEERERDARDPSLGFVFRPTEGILVDYYLRNKCVGGTMKYCPIEEEVDTNANHPRHLTKMYPHTGENVWYFFTSSRANKVQLQPGHGHWRIFGKKRAVSHRSKKVGEKQILKYYEGDRKTKYKLIEYNLVPDEYNVFVCKLYKYGKLCGCLESTLM